VLTFYPQGLSIIKIALAKACAPQGIDYLPEPIVKFIISFFFNFRLSLLKNKEKDCTEGFGISYEFVDHTIASSPTHKCLRVQRRIAEADGK